MHSIVWWMAEAVGGMLLSAGPSAWECSLAASSQEPFRSAFTPPARARQATRAVGKAGQRNQGE